MHINILLFISTPPRKSTFSRMHKPDAILTNGPVGHARCRAAAGCIHIILGGNKYYRITSETSRRRNQFLRDTPD
jgi:hypothetical protein